MHVRILESINLSDDEGVYQYTPNFVNPARDLPVIVAATKTGGINSLIHWQRSANGTDWETMTADASIGSTTDTDDYTGAASKQDAGITSRRAPYFRIRVKGVAAGRGSSAVTGSLVSPGFSFSVRDEELIDNHNPDYKLRTV